MYRSKQRRLPWTATLAVAGLITGCVRPEGAKQTLPGNELFAACTSCHGVDGLGNDKLAAPSIAGLPAWYVEAQLTKFKTGVRGAHPDDLEGLRMRPMSRQMTTPEEVKSVAAYVASMKRPPIPPSLKGGVAATGAASYATCLACHGPEGKGNEQLHAPPIAGQADWYLLSQLKKFKAGIRGTNPADTTGQTMRPMAMTLADEQAMLNVVAHISTLAK
jgi:cytochrome c553